MNKTGVRSRFGGLRRQRGGRMSDWPAQNVTCDPALGRITQSRASRRHLPFRHPGRHKWGWYDPPPLRVSKVCVVELSDKDQRIAIDEYSRMAVRFFYPRANFRPFMRGQRSNFLKIDNFSDSQVSKIITDTKLTNFSPKLFNASKRNLHHSVLRSILSRIANCFRIFIKYL